MDSWVQFVIGPALLVVMTAVLDRRNGRRLRAVDDKVEETRTTTQHVRDQVQNSHKTNLRDDFDRLLAAQHAHHQEFRVFKGQVLDDVAALKASVSDVRRGNEHLAERFDAHLDRRG